MEGMRIVKKKTIVFFIYQMGAGGAARTFLNIMNNLDRSRFNPILVTCDYKGSYEEYLHPEITFIKLKTKRLRSAIFPLAKLIRQVKADLVFSTIPNYNTIAILGRVLSFTQAKNMVREAAYLGGTPKEDMKLRAYGMLYRLAGKVIALSRGVKQNIVQRYKVKPEKIRIIYNPVDLDTIEEKSTNGEIAPEHQPIFAGNDKVIITAGRLVDDKDHQTMLKAFSKVNEEIKSKLVILGEGEREAELKALAKELQIEDRVYFAGFQKNPYVYFKQADVFALSSKREGFGHVLAEALAVGVPVVSTACRPGAVEVLENGKYGKLSDVGDPTGLAENMLEVLRLDDEKRKEMIDQGLARANEFNAKTIVKQYEEAFEDLIDR
jgi:glycosyltransferase involved in cell wall biosynthesis